jgi:aspartate kinase
VKVCKFGGSSLADAAQIRQVCSVIAADNDRRIAVVSAPGKRNSADTKVTDLLIACAEARLRGHTAEAETTAILERFRSIHHDLELPASVMNEIDEALRDVIGSDTSHANRYMDAVKAAGEDNSARLVAATLNKLGLEASYVNPGEAGLLLSDEFGRAQLLPESYDNLSHLRDRKEIVVFPGFFGFTREGEVVTFSRGGSDITGSILAAATDADVYENFTDVSGVCVCDPRVVKDPVHISKMSYREMRELSYAGFGVLHDEAVIPAVQAGIPIRICNTNAPEDPGTLILPAHDDSEARVVGIASSAGFCTFFVSKYLMNREVGFGRRLLQIFEEEGISFEHTPSGIDSMSVIVREASITEKVEATLTARIRNELKVDQVTLERGLALLMIVGEGMRYTVGLAAQATRALCEAGINIEMLNQGSSEISIMIGLKSGDQGTALQALYAAFFGNQET